MKERELVAAITPKNKPARIGFVATKLRNGFNRKYHILLKVNVVSPIGIKNIVKTLIRSVSFLPLALIEPSIMLYIDILYVYCNLPFSLDCVSDKDRYTITYNFLIFIKLRNILFESYQRR
ncbi:MAG UNVERIFIED_CONTAM: hypothetical protein LVQ98_01040 [Rickettsiaceae bacterium]|jgi:hypothetical protein